MKSPIKNLTNILLNDHKFGTSVTLMNKDGMVRSDRDLEMFRK
jgi:hypothetical protein